MRAIVWCYVTVILLCCSSCRKYLDKKTDKQQVVPATLQDLQALLDYQSVMNATSGTATGEASSDNYYVTTPDWNALNSEGEKMMYIWGDEIVYDAYRNVWSSLYDRVNYCNIVLDYLDKVSRAGTSPEEYNQVKGSALFSRSLSFLQAVILWSKQYDPATAAADPGIPLRLVPDINQVSVRAPVKEVYDRILTDLKTAAALLPVTPQHVMRPSRTSAYALLARTFLAVRDYTRAGLYADSSLRLSNALMDYNTLSPGAAFPFAMFNTETMFYSSTALGILLQSKARVDSALYRSYAANDLRKTLFFKSNGDGSYAFKGGYTGSTQQFIGITVDEMYLTKAECLARGGQVTEAVGLINQLLVKRWKTGTYIPFTATTAEATLSFILAERRKELIFRELRWMDIKRLNREPGHEVTIRRVLNGTTYELPPNDLRYALPIPAYVIKMTGMPQNPR